MVKGIAIVLFRLLGVFFCLTALLTLPWTISDFFQVGGDALTGLIHFAILFSSGLMPIAFSKSLAGLIVPRDENNGLAETAVSAEEIVSAGTILIALYLLIVGIGNLVAPILELMEFLWTKTVVMSQDHDEDFIAEGQSIIGRYDYLIAGVAKVVLALIVLLFHPRIAKLARRKSA
ncbi:hypothetical protein FF098_015440 [Parvularcula flava]|uniref:Uncharacterized protein n=1 Tax=Aquisalinus luteolus TaxID=1566827 RepID=A0A8J3A6I8_9PROT|nr:hypothetical protein [Aquisalinus luteolus]NHK29311.1 hypothetical protein [Aquisalinus luteolus]GGI01164.1 hypothetical protein GCM10011355_31160 [Aquisalinus luteolus]